MTVAFAVLPLSPTSFPRKKEKRLGEEVQGHRTNPAIPNWVMGEFVNNSWHINNDMANGEGSSKWRVGVYMVAYARDLGF